jgi:ribosomal protein L29
VKKNVIGDLRKKSKEELLGRREELKKELYEVRSVGVTGGEKPSSEKLKSCRKEVAQILTILRERELQEDYREPLL